MADRREVTDRHEIDRRRFLTWMGLAAAGGVAAIAGIRPKPDNSPKETPTANGPELNNGSSQPEGKKANYWSGEVKDGESLTNAIERISESKIGEYRNFGLIWEHDGVNYIFENRIAFDNQDIVPLPVVWPGDKIVFGSREDMGEDMSERAKLPTQQRVFLEAKNRTLDSEVEKTLTVLGGRFDRPVTYKLNDDGTFWEVNPVKGKWVKSDRFKEIMKDNPDMKSSEALPQLLN